jgi:hypothetical protein
MNLVWCPSMDEIEMKPQMQTMIMCFDNMHKEPLAGGRKQLGAFEPSSDFKLYIMVHGHAQMPMFTCNGKYWNATQLVALLKSDGLKTTWRDIELLVCHAGQSVNKVKIGTKLVTILRESQALHSWQANQEARGITFGSEQTSKSIERVETKFKETAAKGKEPGAYTSKSQLLPMAGQFAQALKSAGYTHFRVISWAAAISMDFFQKKEIELDVPGDSKLASDHKELRMVWF